MPAAVAGIAFLSGGQSANDATAHLNLISRQQGPKPWRVTFCGRPLHPALEAGRDANFEAADHALYRRVSITAAASVGKPADKMVSASSCTDDPLHRRDRSDD